MTINVGDLQIIAANGGGMILDASKYTIGDLLLLAAKAGEHNGRIILRNIKKISVGDLKLIAAKSKGAVIFDFLEY